MFTYTWLAGRQIYICWLITLLLFFVLACSLKCRLTTSYCALLLFICHDICAVNHTNWNYIWVHTCNFPLSCALVYICKNSGWQNLSCNLNLSSLKLVNLMDRCRKVIILCNTICHTISLAPCRLCFVLQCFCDVQYFYVQVKCKMKESIVVSQLDG